MAIPDADRDVRESVLQRCELFRGLESRDLRWLAERFAFLRVDAEQRLIRGGEPVQEFYLVADGCIAVADDSIGRPVAPVHHRRRGEFVGETSLFDDGPDCPSAWAAETSRVLKIDRRDFLTFLREHPQLQRRLHSAAARRSTIGAAATLELCRRREVRLRFNHAVSLELDDGTAHTATLSSLSLGGLSLDGAPVGWRQEQQVSFGLRLLGLSSDKIPGEKTLPSEKYLLRITGRIVWRRAGRTGLAFVKTFPNHDALIQLTIRLLLDSKCGCGPAARTRPPAVTVNEQQPVFAHA